MTEPRNIKIISANAERTVKYKSNLTIFVVWLFSMLAMAFIFFDNKEFLKMPAKEESDGLVNTKPTRSVKRNVDDVQQQEAATESFVLVQYNKKLILTRYSVFSSKNDTDSATQNYQLSASENKPVLIKRPKNNSKKEQDEFFIKSVPQ